ncbi:MAG TPA: hypothetical protein VGL82_21580 [Bryobacteraceae bacterium]|jgi:hypothetical protein
MLCAITFEMAFGLAIFALIFLMRDSQVLALRDGAGIAARLAVYCILQVGAITLLVAFGETGSGVSRFWTDRRFALTAVFIQLTELGIAFALRTFKRGRFSWIGWMLPSPAFLIALLSLSFVLQEELLLSPLVAVQTATLSWLSLVCAGSISLNHLGSTWDDSVFAGDFALMTGCMAFIFVPGFF